MSVNGDVRIVLNLGMEAINKLKKIAKESNTSMGEIVTLLYPHNVVCIEAIFLLSIFHKHICVIDLL